MNLLATVTLQVTSQRWDNCIFLRDLCNPINKVLTLLVTGHGPHVKLITRPLDLPWPVWSIVLACLTLTAIIERSSDLSSLYGFYLASDTCAI